VTTRSAVRRTLGTNAGLLDGCDVSHITADVIDSHNIVDLLDEDGNFMPDTRTLSLTGDNSAQCRDGRHRRGNLITVSIEIFNASEADLWQAFDQVRF